jgi:hypothetical protein
MSRTTTVRGLILIGVAVAVTTALSLTVMATGSSVTPGRAPDSTMVGRLSGSITTIATDRTQGTASISDTAWLVQVLFDPILDVSYLPLITK